MKKIGIGMAVAMLMTALLIGTASAEDTSVMAEGTVPLVILSIDGVDNACDDMNLVRGTVVPCSCDVTVSANADWQLEVEDQRLVFWELFPAAYRGYMVRSEGFMAGPYTRITYPMILGIGSPDENLREGTCLIKGDGAAGASSEDVNVPYTQQVSGSEAEGDYSIELTYILTARTA